MKMKDVRPYTVWTLSCSKRYYLTHPWVWFKHVWCNLRSAYWRSKYGFCPSDVWEFGYWFIEIVPQMLKYLAENGCGYPGNDDFPTPESWKNHLLSIANLLENAREDVRDQKNEYYNEYMKHIGEYEWVTDDNGNKAYQPIDNNISKKYIEREIQLAEEQDIMAEEAIKMLAETPIKRIWD